MLVHERMSEDVATVTPDISVSKAFQVLMERKHSQLPVIDDNGKLVGLLTEKLLSEVSPSKATSLSVFEINYLLSKTKVKDIMKTDIFTIGPTELIEEAAITMTNNDIGSLPVVESNGNLVGIVTRLDIFKAFAEIMGVNDDGARISIAVQDALGTLADISTIITQLGINITHIINFKKPEYIEIVIRVSTTDVEDLITELENKGYDIVSVHKTETKILIDD